MSNRSINSGRKADGVPACDSAATRGPESVETVAGEVLAHVQKLGLNVNDVSTAQSRATELVRARNADVFLPHLAQVLERGNGLARQYAARLRAAFVRVTRPPGAPQTYAVMMPINALRMEEPFSTLFPIEDQTLQAIADRIRTVGYDAAQPIVVWAGTNVVVDGHTRLRAAREAGLTHIPVVCRQFVDADEALVYAVCAQRNRRNMDDTDIMRLVEAIDKRWYRGGDRRSEEARSIAAPAADHRSSEATAKLIGTSATKVEKARAVLDCADPALKDAVASGEKSIHRAATEARAASRGQSERDVARIQAYGKAAGCLEKGEEHLRPFDPTVADQIAALGSAVQGLLARTRVAAKSATPEAGKQAGCVK